MLPVYFPFTSVSRRLMDASSGFFNKMAVYQVSAASIPERMKAWQDDKRLDIRLPLQHHEKEITSILGEFRAWAQDHHGGDISFFKTQGGAIPFFDDSSVAQIRREIKAGGEAAPSTRASGSPDLYPGVFLQMAQDLDEKNREIVGGLESQAAREHALMKALKGEGSIEMPDDLGPGIRPGDQAAYMIPERMAAWARIMLADNLLSPMLITSHPMVLDDLVERATRGAQEIQVIQTVTAPVGDAGHVSRCQDALAAFIADISTSAGDREKERPHLAWDGEATASGARLSLHVIPGMTPRTLLARYLASGGSDASSGEQDGGISSNTVVGVLEA